MAFIIKKRSAWTFDNASNVGIGVEFVAAEGGKIWLNSPGDEYLVAYYYGGAGPAFSAGIKLPKIGKQLLRIKGKSLGGNISPSSFPNLGGIFILDTFDGDELSATDLTGVCMFVEVGGGLIAGGSATAMILGMDPVWLGAILATPWMPNPFFMTKLAKSATAVLVMASANAGVQSGGGVAAYIGGLW
jgi:hypothetical protein